MDANAVSVLEIFEKKMRLEVPLFQRQYVWHQQEQWQPLWEDISRKFVERLEGRVDAPVHFLGAMVLDQKHTPATHVEKRQIIDGQQRLTTLQIFLAALRDFCWAENCKDLGDECDIFTLNRGRMADPVVDRFKVWPTQLDRQQFSDVILSGSRAAIEKKHPLIRKKYSRRVEPRPRMIEAYLFFYAQIVGFFKGAEGEPPSFADVPLPARLDECFQCLKSALKVVEIDLTDDDDAQVIFETLNARGEPLLPADLLRNFIFLRAARERESQENLYEQYWRKFDDPFWRQEIRQGRLSRPRSDIFIQHFLASRQATDIGIKHLFVEYKFWIQKARPFNSVREELATLSRQGDDYRRLTTPQAGDILFRLAKFLDVFEISTVYPALLALLNAGIDDAGILWVSQTLESYFLRRSVCGLTNKNYNRLFLGLVKLFQLTEPSPSLVRQWLSEQTGESAIWPNDETFRAAFLERHVYQTLNNPKIVYILRCLNGTYLESKHEAVEISNPLTVEHIMPQAWLAHWPLPGGMKGLDAMEVLTAAEDDPAAAATKRRNQLLQTFGNLTILTQGLNSAISNSAWPIKKPELLTKSLLPINSVLYAIDVWNEDAIQARGKDLANRALTLWPR